MALFFPIKSSDNSSHPAYCPQGGDEELRASLPLWPTGSKGSAPGVRRAMLGPSTRSDQQHPRGLDHQLLSHCHGAVLPAGETALYHPHSGPPTRPRRYHTATAVKELQLLYDPNRTSGKKKKKENQFLHVLGVLFCPFDTQSKQKLYSTQYRGI